MNFLNLFLIISIMKKNMLFLYLTVPLNARIYSLKIIRKYYQLFQRNKKSHLNFFEVTFSLLKLIIVSYFIN